MLQFTNPVVGGVSLVRPAIQNPAFETGVSGWRVGQDGNTEFNGGTFRGIVTASVFEGNNFVMDSAGIFFYV